MGAWSWLWTFGMVPELPGPELLKVALAKQVGKSKALIIDVRTANEWRGGHVVGAINASFLPPWGFESLVMPILKDQPKDAEIYLICLSAHRSIGALKFLRDKKGFTNAKQLKGGMKAWRALKLPEEKSGFLS